MTINLLQLIKFNYIAFSIYKGITNLLLIIEQINSLEELHIGKAVWTYKGLDFGLVDMNENIINNESGV